MSRLEVDIDADGVLVITLGCSHMNALRLARAAVDALVEKIGDAICVECGNDLVCEGFDYCSECLENGAAE